MSNRLDSLNPKKAPAKPGLKFKPKAVARKSKEDRDRADVKVEETPRLATSSRGRASARGRGRGRGAAYVGTHLVSSGPLAMGLVGLGGAATSSKTGNTPDQVFLALGEPRRAAASALSGIKLKTKADDAPDDLGLDLDLDADGPTKINMNKEYQFEDAATALFPVQPHKDHALIIQPELVFGEALVSPAASRAPLERAPLVKLEADGGVAPAPQLAGSEMERDEHDKRLDDQRSIVDLLSADLETLSTGDAPAAAAVAPDPAYVLMHLPPLALRDPAAHTPSLSVFAAHAASFEGAVGALNFHKLGKISVTLADGTLLECTAGAPAALLQELYVVDLTAVSADDDAVVLDADGRKNAGSIYRLGHVLGKIVATPAIE